MSQCGESRETKDWSHLLVTRYESGPTCLHTDTAKLTADFRKAPKPLVTPAGNWVWLNRTEMSNTYLLRQIEVNMTNPWFQGSHHYLTVYMTNPWFQGSHHYLVWGQWILTNPWFQGSHHYLVWGQWIYDESLIPFPLLGVGIQWIYEWIPTINCGVGTKVCTNPWRVPTTTWCGDGYISMPELKVAFPRTHPKHLHI